MPLISGINYKTYNLTAPSHPFIMLILGSFSIGVLVILVLLVQLIVCIYSILWSWLIQNSTWGRLMQNYAVGLDKIDVARGRSVPAPPYGINHSSVLRKNLAAISGYVTELS